MKKYRPFILIFVTFILLIVVEYTAPKPIDWAKTYSIKDKIPYGCYASSDLVSKIFPGKKFSILKEPLYNQTSRTDNKNYNYIYVNASFTIDKTDTKVLLRKVYEGSQAFIAAEQFKGTFKDTFDLETTLDFFYNVEDSLRLNFSDEKIKEPGDFRFRKGTVEYYFTDYDSSKVKPLGFNSHGKVNFIELSFGKGKFYINTCPNAFTNYNILKELNSEYAFRALSFLPVEDTFWDEFYKQNSQIARSPFRYILSVAPLKWAYFVLLTAFLLFIIFEAKRRQRIIPEIPPLRNTSKEFAETMGRLYLNKGNHKNIAEKKLFFFLDHLRLKYNIKEALTDPLFQYRVGEKLKVTQEDLERLFWIVQSLNETSKISDENLLKISSIIEEFKNKYDV